MLNITPRIQRAGRAAAAAQLGSARLKLRPGGRARARMMLARGEVCGPDPVNHELTVTLSCEKGGAPPLGPFSLSLSPRAREKERKKGPRGIKKRGGEKNKKEESFISKDGFVLLF